MSDSKYTAMSWMVALMVAALGSSCAAELGGEPVVGDPMDPIYAEDGATPVGDDPIALEDAEAAMGGDEPDALSLDDEDIGVTSSALTASQIERDFLAATNKARTDRGLRALKRFWDLDDDARAQARRMRDRGSIYHNPNLRSATPYWLAIGENVGRGPTVDSIQRAFMDSPGHRANILRGEYDYVGVGVTTSGTTIWVVVVFMRGTRSDLTRTFPPFNDDDFNTHERDIHAVWKAGITNGCGPKRFCPGRTLTRAEMAVLLVRALEIPPSTRDYFVDDNGAWYEASVNALAAAGVTTGCGSNRFCPTQQLTRGQMALFLTRALGLPRASRSYFTDTAGKNYEDAANRLREAGITNGCGSGRYCGEELVTRAQMASFLARGLGL